PRSTLFPYTTLFRSSAVSGASLELKDLALGGHDDIGRSSGDAAGKLIERIVGTARLVVGQHDPSRPGPLAQADRIVGCCVAERGLGRNLLGQQERIVQQQVNVAGEIKRVPVVLTPSLRSRPEGRGAVIRQVGDHAGPVADPVAECRAALVRDLPCLDREALCLQRPWRDGAEGPGAAQPARRYRKMRW